MTNLLPVQNIREKTFMIRGFRVMLDRNLAELYGVETRVLNQAVRRNIKRFPEDFMFQLTLKEESLLRSQIVILVETGGNRGQTPVLLIISDFMDCSPKTKL